MLAQNTTQQATSTSITTKQFCKKTHHKTEGLQFRKKIVCTHLQLKHKTTSQHIFVDFLEAYSEGLLKPFFNFLFVFSSIAVLIFDLKLFYFVRSL